MAKKRQPPPDMNLPADLVSFLAAGKQLEYDPATCKAGALTLRPLAKLRPHRFPVETSGSPVFEQDPHFPKVNSYLVLESTWSRAAPATTSRSGCSSGCKWRGGTACGTARTARSRCSRRGSPGAKAPMCFPG